MTSPRPPLRAFTLIEIMIVVLILAIVGAVAVPNMGNTTSTQLTEASRILASDLEYAQMQSMAHPDDPCTVVFPDAGGWFITRASDYASDGEEATPITHPVTKQPYRMVPGTHDLSTLSAVTVSGIAINEDPDVIAFTFGRWGDITDAASATISLGAGDRTVTLTMDVTTGEATISAME